ncbi:MAG: hypothetical protein WCA49_04215 [Candidatus Sulfotelmatobacter sp.]
MTDLTFTRRRKVSFVIANASALLLLAAMGIRLARYWNNTSGLLHFWALFMVGGFVFLWFSLVREKSARLSWSNLLSLCFAVLVLLGADGILSS